MESQSKVEEYDEQFEVNLTKTDYLVSVKATEVGIFIEAEDKTSGQLWNNMFMDSFIESITKRTGHAKKYYVFCRMLRNSLLKTSASVYLDILDPRDIQFWKLKAQGKPVSPQSVPEFNEK